MNEPVFVPSPLHTEGTASLGADVSAAPPYLSNAFPAIAPARERVIRIVAVLALIAGVYWIGYRWTSTLNPDAVVFSVVLALAETYALVTTALLVFTVWRLKKREPPPAPDGLTVDVFITNYDEPLEILRRTALGARALRYPHRTWLLDDGKREEVLELARELDIGYIRRPDNEHAKAGNLNHALTLTDGEFVLQLDADHVPLPSMLDRMLGYFIDEKVAFVQSPQDFYNTDSFTHVVNDSGRRMWEENRIFFSLIQPGKDYWNAAFFCGSCGVLRRRAFDDIGGFSTRTITEDMETSLVLHARGWSSVYHSETLAYGLSPASAGAYQVQRLRWGQGSMQILRHLNPLAYPGLTWPQRILYFASVITYLDGFQKLVFYAAPLIFLIFGVLPVATTNAEFLPRLAIYLTLTIAAFELLSRGTGYILIGERFNMAKFFTYMVAVSGYFAKGKLKFNVTPKGASDVPFRTYAPQLVLLAVSTLALIWATAANYFGWIEYAVPGLGSAAFLINAAWAVWNMYFAAYVVRQSLRLKQQRSDHRFLDAFPIDIEIVETGDRLSAVTHDLNPTGVGFRMASELERGTMVRTTLPLSTASVQVQGTVQNVRRGDAGHGGAFHMHGVQFEDLPPDVRDDIELHCTQHSVPMWRLNYRQSVPLVQRLVEIISDARFGRRRLVRLPAEIEITHDDGTAERHSAMLEETSDRGARLLLEQHVIPGTNVRYRVPGTGLNGTGQVAYSRMLESPMAARYIVGVALARGAAVPAGAGN